MTTRKKFRKVYPWAGLYASLGFVPSSSAAAILLDWPVWRFALALMLFQSGLALLVLILCAAAARTHA